MENSRESHGKYGGSISEAGGSIGEYASAKENQYFKEQDEKILNEMAAKINEDSKQKTEAK